MAPQEHDLVVPAITGRFFDEDDDCAVYAPSRYKLAHGGRGGGKSWSIARLLVYLASIRKIRILCAREVQNSIADSVHALLSEQMRALGLSRYYRVTEKTISSTIGSEFIFAGLRTHGIDSVKSKEGIDICWIEEAQSVSKTSMSVLTPTIRKPGSEIWLSFNLKEKGSAVHDMLMMPPPSSRIVKVNYYDNPYCPDVLIQEADHCRSVDYDAYRHIWEGEILEMSEAVIFRGKFEEASFDAPEDAEFMHGVDWGFSTDPTAAIRCFESPDRQTLFIDREAYGVGIEIDHLPGFFEKAIPTLKDWPSYADNARPETISYIRRQGYWRMNPCDKWKGSVEDGIEYLRGYRKIIIHPSCKKTLEEFGLYKYKVDKVTGDILPVAEDKFNHCVDAVRYALGKRIRQKRRPPLNINMQKIAGI